MTSDTDSAVRQIEFELEKAERGMAMPYDAERVVARYAPRGTQTETIRRAEGETGADTAMTTLTLRRIKDDFVVTGPDIAPAKFTNRREAKDWCATKYPGTPIKEIGADESQRRSRAMRRKGSLRRRGPPTTKSNDPVGSDGVL